MCGMSYEDPKLARLVVQDGKQFGRLLSAARHANGLHQQEVANLLNVSRGTIAFRERNRRQITVDQAVKHLDVLGYDLAIVARDD